MTNASEYLEAARIEELAAKFAGEQFDVTVRPEGPDEGYDILATKGGRTIAIGVKAGSRLAELSGKLPRLRRRARECGYEFRLDVVNPPVPITANVENLEAELGNYLIANPPGELLRLSPQAHVEHVIRVQVDSLRLTRGGARVSGTGILEAQVPNSPLGDGADDYRDSFPLTFDITLAPDLRIARIEDLRVDTSAYTD